MRPARLTTSESLALDVIRVVASALVAFGHLTQPFFSTRWPDLTWIARFSVAIFFLLSGFVIRYVTTRNPATFKHYLGDRASRIYSIAIPALAFTLIADTISRHTNPTFYQPWERFYTHPLLAIAANLVFCGHLWRHVIEPLSNTPFWSVGYEVAYYLLYGCWFYLTGLKRWLWIAAISLFFGPRVLYLAPLWIIGCILHDLYQRWNFTTAPDPQTTRLTWLSLTGLAILIALFTTLCKLTSSGHDFTHTPLLSLTTSAQLKPADYLFGLLWTLVFAALLYLARQVILKPDTTFVRTTHFIAEGTFPIYLLHFPLFVLIAACIPYNHASAIPKLAILATALTLGILAGHPGNLFKNKLRSLTLFQP